MSIKDMLAIAAAALGVVGGSISTKKRKEKKKENVNCCPKCGSHRVQGKKGGKFRCLDCGKKSYYCIREVWIEETEE